MLSSQYVANISAWLCSQDFCYILNSQQTAAMMLMSWFQEAQSLQHPAVKANIACQHHVWHTSNEQVFILGSVYGDQVRIVTWEQTMQRNVAALSNGINAEHQVLMHLIECKKCACLLASGAQALAASCPGCSS